MSRLLQRLASQVVSGGPPRVRAAISMRRAPPLIVPPETPRRGLPREDAFAPATFERAPFEAYPGRVEAPRPLTPRSANLPEDDTFAQTSGLAFTTRPQDRIHPESPEFLLPEVHSDVASRDHATHPPAAERHWEARRISTTERRVEEEPHEVHVHIGRIEVTAVHEPAGKRPKREPARPTKTLEEYLAGRPRGTP